MFLWFCWCSVSFVLTTIDGLAVLESEVIKKILHQDPAFCFRPSGIDDCNGNHWNDTSSSNLTIAEIFDSNKKTLAFLFTRNNSYKPEFLHQCHYHLPNNTHFDPRFRTEIFIHGFLDGVCRSAWMREMKMELFKRGHYNVILVDWTWGNGPKYPESAENTELVGKQIAFLIRNIMMQTGIGPDNFHLVGHSLGAHIAGFAGKIVKNLRRITGDERSLLLCFILSSGPKRNLRAPLGDFFFHLQKICGDSNYGNVLQDGCR